jgi:hypothetical protein
MQQRRRDSDASNADLENLENDALDLLGILALEGSALTPKRLFDLAKARGVRGPTREQLTPARVRMLTDNLRERGFAVVTDHKLTVPEELALEVLMLLRGRGRLARLNTRKHESTARRHYWTGTRDLACSLRVAVAESDTTTIAYVNEVVTRMMHPRDLGRWLVSTLGHAPATDTLRSLPSKIQANYLVARVASASAELIATPDHLLEAALELGDKDLRMAVGRVLILRGEAKRAMEIDGLPSHGAEGLSLLAAFWAGDYAEAANIGDRTLAAKKGRKPTLPEPEGIFHLLAKLATEGNDPVGLKVIGEIIAANTKPQDEHAFAALFGLHRALTGAIQPKSRGQTTRWQTRSWVSTWLDALHDVWLGVRPDAAPNSLMSALDLLGEWSTQAASQGYHLVARELDAAAEALSDPANQSDQRSLATAFRAPAAWEAALIGIDSIFTDTPNPAGAAKLERRLYWELQLFSGRGVLGARCRTSRSRKGQSVSLSRLLSEELDYLDADDQRVIAAAEPDQEGMYYSFSRPLTLGPKALVALIGHPRAVDEKGERLSVVRGQPRIVTTRTPTGIQVNLTPAELLSHEVYCVRRGERVEIFERTESLARVAQILGPGLEVPERGLERLGRTLVRVCLGTGIEIEGELRPEAE